jgi:hypothetical protein
MEAAMANITLDGICTTTAAPVGATLTHRLRVLARAHRRGRARRARALLTRGEMRDSRWFADIGANRETHYRREWLAEMARGMDGRL